MLIVEVERAKEPPIDTRRVLSPLVPAHVLPSLLARPTELDRFGEDGGRNEEATGSGAGQSVG